MNKRSPVHFAVPLLFSILFTSSPARAYEPGMSKLSAQLEQCLQAQNSLQCRSALPACDTALKTLVQRPANA